MNRSIRINARGYSERPFLTITWNKEGVPPNKRLFQYIHIRRHLWGHLCGHCCKHSCRHWWTSYWQHTLLYNPMVCQVRCLRLPPILLSCTADSIINRFSRQGIGRKDSLFEYTLRVNSILWILFKYDLINYIKFNV